MSLIRSVARETHNPRMAALAVAMKADPLAKVKQLVRDLITRLLDEHNSEITQKSWCEEELAKSRKSRDYAHEHTEELTADVNKGTAVSAELNGTIATLSQELSELRTAQTKADSLRATENKNNVKAMEDAETGERAVKKAIQILKAFYSGAQYENERATLGLVQANPVDSATPDAGFDTVYKGKQNKATGVVGMLQVILSDFQRQFNQVSSAESQAHKDHVEFTIATRGSISAKSTGKRNSENELESTLVERQQNYRSLISEQKKLDLALQELDTLRPACIDNRMTEEERAAARQKEIQALEKALTILA